MEEKDWEFFVGRRGVQRYQGAKGRVKLILIQ